MRPGDNAIHVTAFMNQFTILVRISVLRKLNRAMAYRAEKLLTHGTPLSALGYIITAAGTLGYIQCALWRSNFTVIT